MAPMYREPPTEEDFLTLECHKCGVRFDQEEPDCLMPAGLEICDPCLLKLRKERLAETRGANWVWRLLELWKVERRHELLWFRPQLKLMKGGRYLQTAHKHPS